MKTVIVSGSPFEGSRCDAVIGEIERRLGAMGIYSDCVKAYRLPGEALMCLDAQHPTIQLAINKVLNADLVIVVTPIFQGSISGGLKLFLDLLPQRALQGKMALPVAVGGTARHFLVTEYALAPVLRSLAAAWIGKGFYATSDQISLNGETPFHSDLSSRLDECLELIPRMPISDMSLEGLKCFS